MSILLKQIKRGKKLLEILLRQESDTYRRLPGAIPPETVEAHVNRVAEELHQFPESTTKAEIRAMYHTSPEDSREHITVDGYDAKGNHTKTIHVAKNKEEQQDYQDWTKSAAPVTGSMYSAAPSSPYATGSMYSVYSAPSTSHASSSQWANPMASSAGAVYPFVATSSYASPSYSTTPAATSSESSYNMADAPEEYWQYSEKDDDYYHIRSNGKVKWYSEEGKGSSAKAKGKKPRR